jgi:hypothetical protein
VIRTFTRTLNWPEPYEACREGAVNRRLAPSFTVLVAKCPADWALRTQKTTLPATISMKRRCRGHRATVTRERPSSGSGSSVMCVLGSPLWNVKLLPERSSSSGTLSTCSNVDQIHCGRDGVLYTIWRPTSPTVAIRQAPVCGSCTQASSRTQNREGSMRFGLRRRGVRGSRPPRQTQCSGATCQPCAQTTSDRRLCSAKPDFWNHHGAAHPLRRSAACDSLVGQIMRLRR